MLRVGLTGGIGSGKSTIAQAFALMGVPVFNCDKVARANTDNNPLVVNTLKSFFGDDIYIDGKLQRKRLAQIIFSDPHALANVNNLIHPIVFDQFIGWCKNKELHHAPYVVCEAAILYESGMDSVMNAIIYVDLPVETRIERAMLRDNANRQQIEQRIRNQSASIPTNVDFIISPDDRHLILPQILDIHKQLTSQ